MESIMYIFCPLCGSSKVKKSLEMYGIKCPVCDNKGVVLDSVVYGMGTSGLPKCDEFKSSTDNIIIPIVSDRVLSNNYVLSGVFSQYELTRIGVSSGYVIGEFLVPVKFNSGWSMTEGTIFPFSALPARIVNQVAPKQYDKFYVYLSKITEDDYKKKSTENKQQIILASGYTNYEPPNKSAVLISSSTVSVFLDNKNTCSLEDLLSNGEKNH